MTMLDCDVIKHWLEAGATLLDVRSSDEHRQSTLPQAKNIPLPLLPVLAAERLDRDRPVLVFCHSGGRAQTAMQLLHGMGFNDVINIGGVSSYQHC